ncbi:arsenic resistance protein [Microlunatus soli]|nr:bile acid:sodium symporter [Microlunatus soli]
MLSAAILLGCAIGLLAPGVGTRTGALVSPTVLILVSALFFEARFTGLAGISAWRVAGLAWGVNFLIIPILGYVLARLFVGGQQAVFIGLFIYLAAPCTDWFLGFTRIAGGNTAVGSMLLPVNMITQLIGYPILIWLFFSRDTGIGIADIAQTLLLWFAVPFAGSRLLRRILSSAAPRTFRRLSHLVSGSAPLLIAALIVEIFAGNARVIADHGGVFLSCLIAICVFFVLIFIATELIGRLVGLEHHDHVLLTMTTAARNAPLMLAVTALALPGRPLTYAAIVIGMLIEFPHLVIISMIFRRRRQAGTRRASPAGSGRSSMRVSG